MPFSMDVLELIATAVRSESACLPGFRFRIAVKAWMFVCCVGSGLRDRPIPRPEVLYRACVCLIV